VINAKERRTINRTENGVTQIMYTHVSKCKNDKIKIKNPGE
jgi:hypothetical protein